jgi:malate dehydrogenase (oxaloacetate-decarboxylating)
MPVMEGKCVLFKHFGGVDAVPLCLRTKDVDEIVRTIYLLSGSFRRRESGGHRRPPLL